VDEAPTMIRTPASACSGALRLGWVRRSIRDLALLVAGFPWGSGEVLVKRHWSTRSHTQCVPQSRPDIDIWCATSSSRPAAGEVRRSEMDER
jgi:hypothetical protein